MPSQTRDAGQAPDIIADIFFLKKKTRRVAIRLERWLGIPRQRKVLPKPLDMLIATILSQNTNDKNSYRAYTALRRRYRSWKNLAEAPLEEIRKTIRIGGMANQKSRRIAETLAAVKSRYGSFSLSPLRKKSDSEVIRELMELNGVGFKTASCVLLFSLGRDVFPVDTHVHRICGRLGLAPGCKTPEQTFEWMQGIVPAGKGYAFHTNLIRFGRKVCRASRPVCRACVLFDDCSFADRFAYARRSGSAAGITDYDFMLLDNVQ